jgi:predicted nicotinamide N-methyase
MEIEYKVKTQVESIGEWKINIECLEDLNQTIDQVFSYLETQGNPQALEELCPYFGVIWPSARGLAEYLSTFSKAELRSQRVLELGCGLALPSMIAEKKGAQVTATDFHPIVPRFLDKNIEHNQLIHLNYLHINWEKENIPLPAFDWIIGSDILYERRFPEPLAATITKYLLPHGKVIIADPGRPYLQEFVDEMKKQGFTCNTKILKVPHPPSSQEVFILIFDRSEKL